MSKLIEKMGGRKVVFGLLLLTVGVAVTLYLRDLPQNLMIFMSFIGSGFFIGNSMEHLSQRSKTGEVTAADVTGLVAQINNVLQNQQQSINELKAQGEVLAEATATAANSIQQVVATITGSRAMANREILKSIDRE